MDLLNLLSKKKKKKEKRKPIEYKLHLILFN